jgi:hypothetical protein
MSVRFCRFTGQPVLNGGRQHNRIAPAFRRRWLDLSSTAVFSGTQGFPSSRVTALQHYSITAIIPESTISEFKRISQIPIWRAVERPVSMLQSSWLFRRGREREDWVSGTLPGFRMLSWAAED